MKFARITVEVSKHTSADTKSKGAMTIKGGRYLLFLLLPALAHCAPQPQSRIPYSLGADVFYQKPGRPEIRSEYNVPAPIGALPTATAFSVPKSCEGYLPANFARPAKPVATLFSLQRAINGDLRNVAIYQSSGDPILDSAVLSCVKGRRLPPLIIDGNPAQVTQIWSYYWGAAQSYFADPSTKFLQDNLCNASYYYPALAVRLNQEGTVVVGFDVNTDGSVRNPAILQTSGHSFLDGGAITCVENLQFYPVTRHGKPVEFYAVRPVTFHLVFDADPSSTKPDTKR